MKKILVDEYKLSGFLFSFFLVVLSVQAGQVKKLSDWIRNTSVILFFTQTFFKKSYVGPLYQI